MTRACPEPKVSRTLLMLLSESLMPEPSTIRYGIGNRLKDDTWGRSGRRD